MGRRPGFATIAVLRALAEGAEYGLDVMERTGLPSGTVYPLLSRLEREGAVRGSWESRTIAHAAARPRRRYYRLTRAGVDELETMMRQWRPLVRPLPGDRDAFGEGAASWESDSRSAPKVAMSRVW